MALESKAQPLTPPQSPWPLETFVFAASAVYGGRSTPALLLSSPSLFRCRQRSHRGCMQEYATCRLRMRRNYGRSPRTSSFSRDLPIRQRPYIWVMCPTLCSIDYTGRAIGLGPAWRCFLYCRRGTAPKSRFHSRCRDEPSWHACCQLRLND